MKEYLYEKYKYMIKANTHLSKIVILLLISLFCNSCSIMRNKATFQTYSDYIYHTDFVSYTPIRWTASKLGNDSVEKSGLFIPVHINGIDKDLYMQLDLGANITLLYGKTLNSLELLAPDLQARHVVTKDNHYLANVSIELNQATQIKSDKLRILKDFGSENIDTSFIIIGTLGYDIIGNQKLIIDYKNDRIALAETLPLELEQKIVYIEKADFSKFPIILPFTLNNKKIRLLYDTGSSLFPIITGTNRLKKLASYQKIDTIPGLSSWGKVSNTYRLKNVAQLKLMDFDFGNIDVYGSDNLNNLKFTGKYLYGLTGNVNFNKMIVIIDRENNKFGLIK